MKRFLYMLFLIVFPLTAFSQEKASGNDAMGFSRIFPISPIASMGYAGRASESNGAWASFINPATVPSQKEKVSASVSWQNFLGSTFFGAGSFKSGRLGISAGIMSRRGEYIDVAFNPIDVSAGAGVALELNEKVSVGVSLLYLESSIYEEMKMSGLGIDILSLISLPYGFHLAAGISDIGKVHLDNSSYSLPGSALIGVDWTRSFGSWSLKIDSDADYFISGSGWSIAFGAEIGLKDMFFIRGGYHLSGGSAPPIPSFASLGIGASFYGVHLDISYIKGGKYLGNNIGIGLGYLF